MKGIPTARGLEKSRPLIAVALPGTNAVEIFAATAQHAPQYDYLVFVPRTDPKAQAQLSAMGARYTTEISFLIHHAATCDALLTFGCLPHPAHGNVLLATSLMKELGKPVIDIQHGLYQWGVNFSDDSLEQGFAGTAGISLQMRTRADLQLTWAGDNAVGYPRFLAGMDKPAPGTGPILVATNTNWHIYAEEDRHRLMRILRQVFTRLNRMRFIWKPHPAELSTPGSLSREFIDTIVRSPNKFPNVEIIGLNPSETTLTELISGCSAGIATIGTAVIDFEMLGKPCVVYDSPAVRGLNDNLPRLDRFTTFEALLGWIGAIDEYTLPPQTGQLRPFDAAAFEKLVTRAMITAAKTVPVEDPLPLVIKYLALAKSLNS